MPVINPKTKRKKNKKNMQKIDLDTKLAKMAIADWWARDTDNTRYYVNVTANDGKNWVRIRIDISDSEPLILLLEPDFAVQLANAIFRAAFNAKIMKPSEVMKLWSKLKGQFKKLANPTKKSDKEEEDKEEETMDSDGEVLDIEFA